jgi:glutamate/tyrosine decarboxylase-like PLP-dependent enzyme
MRTNREPSGLEETLDPDDWDAFRRFAHGALDDTLDYLATVRERTAWQPVPGPVRERLRAPAPVEPEGFEAAYRDFLECVRPFPTGNIHPRFWGWVQGNGTPLGMIAELLAAGMNPNAAAFEHSAAYVELQVLGWFKSIMGFPDAAGGLLVSGGSMANLVGLAAARNNVPGLDARARGLHALGCQLVLYASSETHSSVRKAVELLGLGADALRLMPVRDDFRIDPAALEAAIAEDRDNGLLPFCVVANAGTVNTGAIDPLDALADICRRESLWLHVDGAFGALAALSPALKSRLAGMERADSLAFDCHKWMCQPYDVACALVRSATRHRAAFSVVPDYLERLPGGLALAPIDFSEYGVQLSRSFRALKLWLSIKAEGLDKFRRVIEQNVAQAAYLAARIQATGPLELLAPTPLNIVNFRYAPPGLAAERLDKLNCRILIELQERGIAVPSSTRIAGRFSLRVANVNHRSRREDFDLLVDETVRLGGRLAATV